MRTLTKTAAALVTGAGLALAPATSALAATQTQDGLVNVAVGDVTVQDVNVGVAAQIVATVCDVQVGPIAVLGTAVDRSGDSRTVCTSEGQPVTISQN